jgi:TonB family protein
MTECHDYRLRITVAAVLIWVMAPLIGLGQQSNAPRVLSASVPFYPRAPQHAHVEGTVRLRVSTDGARVANVQIESGQPMLAQAALENVKTWRFDAHSRTSFAVTFRYQLLTTTCDADCKKCDSAERPSILLKLPREVEVNAEEAVVCVSRAEKKQQY